MSEETGKAIEVQRQRVNDLHLRRGEEVRLAREIRESVGRQTGQYDDQWEKVEVLTERRLTSACWQTTASSFCGARLTATPRPSSVRGRRPSPR